jgi:acyl dehydratase
LRKKNKNSFTKKIEWLFKFNDSDLLKFSKISGDYHPLHLNKDYAKKKKFKNKVIFGALLASQISKLVGDKINNKNIMMTGFTIKFKKPAYVNEKLKFIAILESYSSSVSLISYNFIIKNSKNIIICQGKVEALKI